MLEPLVAEIFARQTGYRVYQIQKMFRHPLYPFMQADVDYFIETDDGRHGILECKTSHPNNKGKWADDCIPYNYELQCRHYMAVMNLDFVWIACLFSNSEADFVKRYIERDLDLEEDLIQNEQHFWEDCVQAGVEPPYTENGDLVLASLRKHYGPSDPEQPTILLAPVLALDLQRYVQLTAMKRDYEQLAYYGRGPQENYIDRCDNTFVGYYEDRVANQYYPYIRPQETGNKTDVRWLALLDEEGSGVKITGLQPLSFSALHFSPEDLDPGLTRKMQHQVDVVPQKNIFLHVDLKQRGLGGDNSWGMYPHKEYRLLDNKYSYSYVIQLVGE